MVKINLIENLRSRLLGKTRKTNNMRNFKTSKSNFYVSKDNKDVERPFTVVEYASRKVITRCETRDIAEGIARFQNKTPTFGHNGLPEFLKE
jgi:hypothetical protein